MCCAESFLFSDSDYVPIPHSYSFFATHFFLGVMCSDSHCCCDKWSTSFVFSSNYTFFVGYVLTKHCFIRMSVSLVDNNIRKPLRVCKESKSLKIVFYVKPKFIAPSILFSYSNVQGIDLQ